MATSYSDKMASLFEKVMFYKRNLSSVILIANQMVYCEMGE